MTIVEILVAVGVIAILLSLLMPALTRVRERAAATQNASNVRQMGLGLALYAASYNDLPPSFGEPVWPPRQPWKFDFGEIGTGNWFEHAYLYALAVTGELEDTRVASAPRRPNGPYQPREHQGRQVSFSDYYLTESLYAEPAFFNWNSQVGPSQFARQRFASIAYPDAKGLIYQTWIFHLHSLGGPVPACCILDVPSPIYFADGSVSEHVIMRMRPGFVNLYGTGVFSGGFDPTTEDGIPVAQTIDGILGRDKP